MNAAKVVEGKPKRDRCPVVLPLFAEGVGEPSESTGAHAQAEIGPLDNRSADALRVGLAHDWDYLHRSDFGRAVALLSVLRSTIHLDELSEVAPVVQRRGDRRTVRSKSVRG